MRLGDLINSLEVSQQFLNDAHLEISGLCIDSRKIKSGDLFIALPSVGGGLDGTSFIEQAIALGAAAVLGPPESAKQWESRVCYISRADVRSDLGALLPQFYPNLPETLVAVTGTNGKTSVVQFAQQIWQAAGKSAASIGTLGVNRYPELKTLTSPDPVTMHQLLEKLAQDSVDCVALEASSHGLEQCRLSGLNLKAAAFTNLSHDHLDYHNTLEEYFYAKQRLFRDVLPFGGVAVLNTVVPEFSALQSLCQSRGQKILRYGGLRDDLGILEHQVLPEGQQVKLEVFGTSFDILFPLMGTFQLMNALCALGLVVASGTQVERAVEALKTLKPVAGRLQEVPSPASSARVFVDYAHTPEALETVLKALRLHCLGRVFLVFGCGGERDQDKRPIMGQVAHQYADVVFVTDDNPRSETPEMIRREIIKASPDAIEMGNRSTAIQAALESAGAKDIVLIAGKGHETQQVVGKTVVPFNDFEVASTPA